MTLTVIPQAVNHNDRYFLKRLYVEAPACVVLDKNAFQNEMDCLEKAIKYYIDVIIASPKTFHFFRPDDPEVNHTFKRILNHLKCELSKRGVLNFGDVRTELMLTVVAYE